MRMADGDGGVGATEARGREGWRCSRGEGDGERVCIRGGGGGGYKGLSLHQEYVYALLAGRKRPNKLNRPK